MKRVCGGYCALTLATALMGTACGAPPQADQAEGAWPKGVVLETMNAGGYTYAHVELDDTDLWVAGPVTPLKVGDTVSLVDTMAMGSFPSKELDRTFDEMFFVMSFREDEGVMSSRENEGVFLQAAGIAKQVIATGGYTYVEVEGEEGTFWLAGPETEIAEGTVVQWKGPMLMRDFHSSSLDRTFSEIMFVDSVWMSGGPT